MEEDHIHIPRITPPTILVEDINHEDPFAVFIRNHIYEYAKRLLESDEAKKFYGHDRDGGLGWFSDINRGHCEGVVVYILETVEHSQFDSNRVKSKGRVREDDNNPVHYWIQYETTDGEYYHFDAEAPWGVKEWTSLPSIRRQLPFVKMQTISKDIDPRDDPNNTVRGFYGMNHARTPEQ